jgi:hypothetical protein
VIVCALAPLPAAAAGCPSADQSYMGNCGPWFSVPSWTDTGGWNDPSQYATILLADVNGDGRDDLLGRSDAGVEVYWFDTNACRRARAGRVVGADHLSQRDVSGTSARRQRNVSGWCFA